jgi:hypothetical protein
VFKLKVEVNNFQLKAMRLFYAPGRLDRLTC